MDEVTWWVMDEQHSNMRLHWLPQDPDRESPITACGMDVDGSCEWHLKEGLPCKHGLAWTRSTDLDSYQRRELPESWPPPCEECLACTSAAG
jgi:hypothetical protein